MNPRISQQGGGLKRSSFIQHSGILERRNSELLDHVPKPISLVRIVPSWKQPPQPPTICKSAKGRKKRLLTGAREEVTDAGECQHQVPRRPVDPPLHRQSAPSTQMTSGPTPTQTVNTKYPEDQWTHPYTVNTKYPEDHWTHPYTDSQHQVPRRPLDPPLHRQSTPSTQKTSEPMSTQTGLQQKPPGMGEVGCTQGTMMESYTSPRPREDIQLTLKQKLKFSKSHN